MIFYEVRSSQIRMVGYDAVSCRMRIIFQGGATYEYENVPATIVTAIMFGASPGKLFTELVKSKPEQFPFARLADAEEAAR